jgi:ABC-2 type transport system ATP-binding protein
LNTDKKTVNQIVVNDVSKTLGKATVLDHISLTLKGHMVYGLVGINGSGKTMLLRVLSGLICPTTGTVCYNDTAANNIKTRQLNIGLTLEHADFYPHLSGKNNLLLLAKIKQLIDDAEVDFALNRVGLDPQDKRNVKEYSLGMKQRLAIAQAIMERPDYLFLDEPMNALDEDGGRLIKKIIKEEAERGAVVLLVSHNKSDIDELCDTVLHIENGRLL